MLLLNYSVFLPKDKSALNNTPLFILHGLMGSMDNWRTQAKKLSLFRPVYTLDLRNHGNSPHVSSMSYREMCDDVINVAIHEDIKMFHLLGHSMGGKVAMQLSFSHPELINQLVIVDIAPKAYPLWHQKMLYGVLNTPLRTLNTRKDIDTYLTDWIDDPNERAFMLKNLTRVVGREKQLRYEWRCNLEAISRAYLKIAGFYNPSNKQFLGNTLFIRGENSNYILDSDIPLIISNFPHCIDMTITNSGHLPHIQQADTFFYQVNQFLMA